MENQSEHITTEQYKTLGEIYRPDQAERNQVISVKNFLNNEQVKEYANTELLKVLSENNVNIEWIVKEKKKLIELSKENKQLNVTLKTIESFENNLGLNNKVKITESRQISQNNSLEDNYSKAKEQQKVTITRQTSENEPEND